MQKQIENTNKQLAQTQNSEKATVHKLDLLKSNISEQKKLIANLGAELQQLDLDAQTIQSSLDSLAVVLEKTKEDYAELIRETHYAQMQNSELLFLLSSDDFQQLLRRAMYAEQIARKKREQAEQILALKAQIEEQKAILEHNRADKSRTLDEQKQQQQNLARDEKKQQKMLSDLKKKEKNLKAELSKQQKKSAELNKKIDDLVRKQTETAATLTKEQQLLAGDFEKNKGRMPWPVPNGTVPASGDFGIQQHPVYPEVTLNNKGLYISTTQGTSARAVFEGEVTACIVLGNTYAVIVQHGSYRTVYSGLVSLNVKQGDKVTAKQNIGVVYTDPEQDNKTELYFQIYKNKSIENPKNWLAR